MANSLGKPSKLDEWIIDPAFDLAEKVVKFPINLIRSGVKKLIHGVLSLPIIPTKGAK